MPNLGTAPLYMAIRRDLQRKIVAGELRVGDWLPSEAHLQKNYQVSQTPVRRALADLEHMGLIERQQGRGSVVRSREIVAVHPMVGFGSELRGQGREVLVRVLAHDEVAASQEVAGQLACEPGTGVLHVTRLFVVDGEPFSYFDHYLGPRVIPHHLTDNLSSLGSLYAFLSRLGLEPKWAHEQITADAVRGQAARLLALDAGSPALLRVRTAYLEDATPIEYTRYWIRPDVYSISIELRNVWS